MIPGGNLAAICMQSLPAKSLTSNLHAAVSQVNKLLNSSTVTSQGQQVEDDDGVILIIFASLPFH
jgi:hypothetical protein